MKTFDISEWGLHRTGDDLCWGRCSLMDLAASHGTPLYVVNKGRLEESYQSMLGEFQACGLDARVYYSFKTNPVPAVLEALVAQGAGAEVISEFEFWLAGRLGVPAGQVIVNGSVKSRKLLRSASERGVALINVESLTELRTLRQIAADLGKQVNIGLRINPSLNRRVFDFTTSTASSTSPFGFLPGGSEFTSALDLLRDEPALRLKGLHFHIGSGIRSAKPYAAAMTRALEVWRMLRQDGFSPEVLDIGGGFSIPTLKALNLWEAVRLFGWGRSPAPPVGQSDPAAGIAAVCARKLREFSQEDRSPMPQVFIESGRALTAPSQLLLLTVQHVVERASSAPCALCDGGAMSLSPMLISEYHEILVVNKPGEKYVRPHDILGNLPTPLDMVALRRRLPQLAPGDVLAVMDTGAYFTSLGNNFAGPRPGMVMIDEGQSTLIRSRETFEDMMSRDMGLAGQR